MKKILFSPWTALLTLILLVMIRVADPSFVESVRLRYFDTLITEKESTTSQQVHVVNIDDAYIRQKGQFPFPRNEYATFISNLYAHGAGLVVFNIYMPERDRFGGDAALSRTLKEFPVVLPHAATSEQVKNNYPPFRPGVSVIGGENAGVNYGNIEPNIKILNDSAAGIGIVNTLPEIDGVTRRVPMVVQSGGRLYPSIALESLRVAAGDPSFQVKVADGNIEAVRIPKFGKITTDNLGRIWVDWSSRPIEHSAANLPQDFGGGIVIVGLTAKGLNNPVATSVGAIYPHYLQASVLDTVISGTNISRPDWSDGAELLYTIALCIIALFFTRFTHGYIIPIILGVGTYYGSKYAFVGYQYLFDVTVPILTITLCYAHGYTVKFLSELRQKLQIKKQFGSYVNPTIVEKLQKNPELIKLGGEKKELSIVMTDLRGFTTLGESFGDDVEGLTQIMNDYMTALSIPVLKNDGTLIKFIGDASLHVHGAPLDDVNHAKTAVKTALEMIKAIEEFNVELTAKGRPPVGMGAGVNTGPTLIGNIGAKSKFGYDVLGDSVSTAARLEGQTKGYGVLLVIGPTTAELVKDEYPVFELDCIAVKGKTIGLNIYTIAHETEQHRQFLDFYYRGQWSKACAILELCKNASPEMTDYYDAMYQRIKSGTAPKDWDGVYHATSK
jgi:adenylate cyclase